MENEENRPEENYEIRERQRQRQEEEEIENQFEEPDRFEDANEHFNNEQETSFMEPEPDIGELFQVADKQKEKLFSEIKEVPITRFLEPELFRKTTFLCRRGSLSVQRIEYNGQKI